MHSIHKSFYLARDWKAFDSQLGSGGQYDCLKYPTY